HNRVHHALYRILELIPTSALKLAKVLGEGFPYKRENTRVQTTYLRNVLRALEYAPMLRESVMQIIIDRILQIDVEIQVELDELEEEEEEEEDDNANEEDDDDDDGTDASEDSASDSDGYETEEDPEQPTEEPAEATLAEIRGLTDKLDSMLQLVFEHLSSRRTRHPPAAVDDFYLLLDVFDRSVLSTFKSRYTQFLLFHQAAVGSELTDVFLGHLTGKLCDPAQPTVTRLAAASYVASYVARAAYLSKQTVRNMMAVLVGWAHLYVDQNEANCSWPDPERYSVFYAAVQAILYIFCFRWRDLRMDMDEGLESSSAAAIDPTGAASSVDGSVTAIIDQQEWCTGLAGLQRIITSRFNPLKASCSERKGRVCSSSVVRQFARLTNRLNFLYVYTIIERNKRLYLPQRSQNSAGGSSGTATLTTGATGTGGSDSVASVTQSLDSFFPFDPYRLPRSGPYVTPFYKEWEADEDEDEDGGYEDDDEEDDDEDVDEDALTSAQQAVGLPGAATAVDAAIGDEDENEEALNEGMLAMSISPQNNMLDAQRQALLFAND
ncbi:RNA polymerase I-specific transcription initiation factor RRN3, partial [Thamnocephalis sphaerospora]